MELRPSLTQGIIDPSSPVPLYYQIREHLREQIRAGVYAIDEALPSERELSDIYAVNRLTVRQAVQELVNEGLLRRQRGVGTFVTGAKITQSMPDLVGFTERMARVGRSTASKTIAFTVELPSKSAAEALRMPPQALSIKLVRVRFVDDEPFMIETSYFPQSRFPALEQYALDREPLYRLLNRVYKVQVIEAQEALEPVILTAYEADLLGTEAGRPGLLVEGTIFATGREPVEFTKSLVRGDKARFLFTLHRTGDSDRS